MMDCISCAIGYEKQDDGSCTIKSGLVLIEEDFTSNDFISDG